MKEKEFIKAIKSGKIVSIGPWGFWGGQNSDGYYYESMGACLCSGRLRNIRSLWNLAKKLLAVIKKADMAVKVEINESVEMNLDLDADVLKQVKEIITK